MADAWRALWTSRLLVWMAGVYAMLVVGFRPGVIQTHATAPFGALGNLLVAPAARWDAGWYLSIAAHPYQSASEAAFFPLYPLGMRGLGVVLGSTLLAGIAISVVGLAVALYFLGRLVALELGPTHARAAVLALAFFPTAVFFSAVYTESLLLALTIAAVYAARTERWAWAGILGGLASATRPTGVLILITLVLLYLYGPRGDPYGPRGDRAEPRVAMAPWRPRHAPRANLLWLLLVPMGLAAFIAYIGIVYGDPLLPLNADPAHWHRHFELLSGIPKAGTALWHALHQIASAPASLMHPATNGPYRRAANNVVDIGFLAFAVIATAGVLKRLPLAYGAYCVASLIVIVSAPKPTEPLFSLPRFIAVLFPLQMWLALWVAERQRLAVWLAGSGVALGVFTAQFATWRWVA